MALSAFLSVFSLRELYIGNKHPCRLKAVHKTENPVSALMFHETVQYSAVEVSILGVVFLVSNSSAMRATKLNTPTKSIIETIFSSLSSFFRISFPSDNAKAIQKVALELIHAPLIDGIKELTSETQISLKNNEVNHGHTPTNHCDVKSNEVN